jgi:hypothetical protein
MILDPVAPAGFTGRRQPVTEPLRVSLLPGLADPFSRRPPADSIRSTAIAQSRRDRDSRDHFHNTTTSTASSATIAITRCTAGRFHVRPEIPGSDSIATTA